jgi:hypothetical protein
MNVNLKIILAMIAGAVIWMFGAILLSPITNAAREVRHEQSMEIGKKLAEKLYGIQK